MEKNKKILSIAMITLVISIVSIGIAFAALSQVLAINGGAQFNPADWRVKYDENSLEKEERGNAVGTMPIISATTIGTYNVTLTKPGDAVVYTFVVENTGSLNGIIDDFSKPEPLCAGTEETAEADAELVCNNLVYTLTNDTENGVAVAIGQTLASTEKQKMVLKIEYPLSVGDIPNNDVTITMPQVIIEYIQD